MMLKPDTMTLPALDEMVRFRLAFSPLVELSISYHTYKHPERHGLYQHWIEEVRRALHGISYPLMDTLICVKNKDAVGCYIPDFLTPTPTHIETDIEMDLSHLLQISPEKVRHYVQPLCETCPDDLALQAIMVNPRQALIQLVDEMRDYWQRALAHHWQRMIAILENDILYRSRYLVVEGAKPMFDSIGYGVVYDNHKLTITYPHHPEKSPYSFDLDEEPIQAVPSVFAASKIYHQYAPDWQKMIIYPSRGNGLWYHTPPKPLAELELVLGVPKARMLFMLQTPLNTGELAHRLVLTAGAVSQQLKNLHQGGLVESFRQGKLVYYRLTERGEKLLALF
jgi:DNA-binding transcriptional ArsR family regulator